MLVIVVVGLDEPDDGSDGGAWDEPGDDDNE